MGKKIPEVDFTEDSARAMVEIIKTIVSRYYDIPLDDIYKRTRKAPIIKCRHLIAYFVITELPDWLPLQWKATEVGYDGDHTLMIYLRKKIQDLLSWDKMLQSEVRDLTSMIKGAIYTENSPMLDEIHFMNFDTFVALRKNSGEAICATGIDPEKIKQIADILGSEFQMIEMKNTGYLLHKKDRS